MANDQTLKRVFSSSSASKYPTIGKFLPPASMSQAVFQSPPTQPQSSPPQSQAFPDQAKTEQNQDSEADLDLLDQLVSQTIINRSNSTSDNQGQIDHSQSTQISSRAKEAQSGLPLIDAAETNVVESAKTSESVEVEATLSAEVAPNPELAELSKELQEVSKETKEQREQAEIKQKQQEISNLAATATTPVAVSDKPVVVLPITAKSKEEAKFKSTKYSVKWLVEWCEKIAKVFSGAVVYKEEIEDV